MNTSQMVLNEFECGINKLEKEVNRRREILNYLKQNNSSYENIVCALFWLGHTTKTAEEIIEILEED